MTGDRPKKLFVVAIETEIAVYAEDARRAQDLARRSFREVDEFDFAFSAQEVTDLKLVDADVADSMPFGTVDDKTVRDLFEELEQETKP